MEHFESVLNGNDKKNSLSTPEDGIYDLLFQINWDNSTC